MWKSLKRCPLQGSPAGNKNRFGIAQLVMAKNRNTSKLIYCNQKQRSNKEPQRAVEITPETP